MKKLLLILLCLPMIFSSCEEEDNISITQEQMITWELNFGDDLWNSASMYVAKFICDTKTNWGIVKK